MLVLYRARHSNCGNILRVFNTIFIWKRIKRTQLIAGSKGNKLKNWTIRSQAPKFVILEYGEGSETKRLSA